MRSNTQESEYPEDNHPRRSLRDPKTMPQIITFAPNVPQTLALTDPTGDWDGGYSVSYPTTDGRTLQLPKGAAVRLNMLDLQPGETFRICRLISGQQGEPAYWDIALTAQTEQAKATKEAQQAATDPPAADSVPAKIRTVPRKPILAEQPRLFDRGTGTNGPVPQPLPVARPMRIPPLQLPYNVAFREIVKFVTEGLKAEGLQWNDQAVQDAVCTILIDAGKHNLLSLWERETDAK